jgi:hypothetical protein
VAAENRFFPGFMALTLRTGHFLTLVVFNRVGAVKQRMHYPNPAKIRLTLVAMDVQREFVERMQDTLATIAAADAKLIEASKEVEEMIRGVCPVEA